MDELLNAMSFCKRQETSNMEKHIQVPFDKDTARTLKAGDMVYLTGTVYTARDAAH